MERKVSIIIPVYNTAKYLPQCLESAISQTYTDIEIIVVDDGSTDGSAAICDAFAAKDPRVQLIHQTNQGVSAARNAGLACAAGDYVFFLDSDDIMPKDCLLTLCGLMENECIATGSIQIISTENTLGTYLLMLPKRQIPAKQYIYNMFHEQELGYQGYLCNKLFDRRLISTYRIRFHEQIKYNEDRLFISEYLLFCKCIHMTPELVYLYRQHPDSAMGKLEWQFHETMLTELDAFEHMRNLMQGKHRDVYYEVAKVTFEKALHWLNKIPRNNKKAKRRTWTIMMRNAWISLLSPRISMLNKAKIIAHCLLCK